MKCSPRLVFAVALLLVCGISLQGVARAAETIDTLTINKIKAEGTDRSKVMETLSWLTDVYGPRLTGSPGHRKAAEWARTKLSEWGAANAHLEAWGPFGRGWSLKHYSANLLARQTTPLLSYPKAWSPGTDGSVTGDVIDLSAVATDSALQTYRGKLKKKFVLLSETRVIVPNFKPDGKRLAEADLLALANAQSQKRRGRGRPELTPEQRRSAMVDFKLLHMCMDEGVYALLSTSARDLGTMSVMGASTPSYPDSPYASRPRVYAAKSPPILPQIVIAAEHYNRIVRMLEKGERVRIEMNLDVEFTRADSSYNVTAEIPGSDLRNELVMIGAHLDSWHAGTGATDNACGSATCMEAIRILKALDLKPRRTIRIGLWSGEEQGLLGSRAYVKSHFGERTGSAADSSSSLVLTPEGQSFCVYFNSDNGTGKFRGVYMQGNEAVRPIFRAWLEPFEGMGAATLTLSNTGSTDHVSFDAIGLPAFQFIQDDMEYFTRTWHTDMDVFDRASEEDMRQNSIIMAAFAYDAAMRDEKIPRKP